MPPKEQIKIVAKKAFVAADFDGSGYLTIDE